MKKLLFARTPRRYWQYVVTDDNFWMPLSYPCLAAALRRRIPDLEIMVVDCCALKMGWKTFERRLREEKPDFYGIGDESMYADEGIRSAMIVREANPDCINIGGGRHYPFFPEWHLGKDKAFDYLVFGEGEETFPDLMEALLSSSPKVDSIPGIIYLDGDKIVRTPLRPVIKDLDTLPTPAFDIMHPDIYGQRGRLWAFRNSLPMQHSRGCVSGCTYCSFWPAESEWYVNDAGALKATPLYRTKSVAKTVDEMEFMYKTYGCRQFNWVDGTWNADPKWNDEWATEILKRKMKFGWYAMMRADMLLRDEKLGILEKIVKSGLNMLILGAERSNPADLENLKKYNYGDDTVVRACQLMRKKYPQVWCQTTYMMGFPDETRESMFSLLEHARRSGADFSAFHFATPYVGTALWDEAIEKGWIRDTDFRNYDWFTPVMKCEHLTPEEELDIYYTMTKKFIMGNSRFYTGLFSPYPFKRGLYWWFWVVAALFVRAKLRAKKTNSLGTPYLVSKKPWWYEA